MRGIDFSHKDSITLSENKQSKNVLKSVIASGSKLI